MDLSRLRAIVKGTPPRRNDDEAWQQREGETTPLSARRELTYEPDTGAYTSTIDMARLGEVLGGRAIRTSFGECLVIDRRYESDRRHGDVKIGDCELCGQLGLDLLDPALRLRMETSLPRDTASAFEMPMRGAGQNGETRTVFVDLETTGLSGGAGTVAFLVGCGYFDLGAFQVRQFLLTSFSGERALLAAVSEFFDDAGLIVTYNGKTFDLPVMETRWAFHRIDMPLEEIPHFDMLHPARRLWKLRAAADASDEGGCRLSTLERTLFEVRRAGDVPGAEIPSRFFRFLRSGDPRPLEPVLEHNRLDLVSLAAVTARAVQLAQNGVDACRDCAEALALGRVYETAGALDRAQSCYRRAATSDRVDIRGEALYRLGIRFRRERRFHEAAEIWREVIALAEGPSGRGGPSLEAFRQFAAEALAIHHEHRARDYETARELALFALDELEEEGRTLGGRADGLRHRLARLNRKIAATGPRLFSN